MKIATWNVNECVGITTDLNNQKTVKEINKDNIKEIINKINEYDFDIICFQEYPVYINDNVSLTKEIINNTKLKYYETYDTCKSFLFNGGRVGVAIFSKYELNNVYKTLFNNPNMEKVSSSGEVYHSFDKPIIKADINYDNNKYTIITGHAIAFAPFNKSEFDYPKSYKPLEDLINNNMESNLIVLGDFNTEKIFELIPSIKDKVIDVVNMSTTKDYYEGRGEVQMDYILINKNLKYNNIEKIDNFSDHYIVLANIIK